jgi:hypothetical protein
MADEESPTIADVLSGRLRIGPGLTITAAQRHYYDYRGHGPSVDLERSGVLSQPVRDFRSARERATDSDRDDTSDA